MNANDFAKVIDHTFLQTEAEGFDVERQLQELIKLVNEANRFGAYAVCVRPTMVAMARQLIDDLGACLKVVSVIGFPNGDAFSIEEKLFELEKARKAGADEYDMVMRVESFRNHDEDAVVRDIEAVSKAAREQVLKVIVENAYLTDEQKPLAWQLVFDALTSAGHMSARFLKTSTGFASVGKGVPVGATLPDVEGMYRISQGVCGLKPAGGISDLATAKHFFEAAGSPIKPDGGIDPMKFRIGSSKLLGQLFNAKETGSDQIY